MLSKVNNWVDFPPSFDISVGQYAYAHAHVSPCISLRWFIPRLICEVIRSFVPHFRLCIITHGMEAYTLLYLEKIVFMYKNDSIIS